MGFTAAQFGSRRQGGLSIPQPSLPDVRPFSPSSPQRASSGQGGENLTLRERLAIEDEFATKRADREALAKKSIDEETLRRDATERSALEGILFPERASAVPKATLDLGDVAPRRQQTLSGILGGPDAGGEQGEPSGVEFEPQTARPGFQPNIPLKSLRDAVGKKVLRDTTPESDRRGKLTPSVQSVQLEQKHIDSGKFPKNAKVGDFYQVYTDPSGEVHSVLRPEKRGDVGDHYEGVASREFGDTPGFSGFSGLNQDQQKRVSGIVKEELEEDARRKSRGRVGGALDVQLSGEERRTLRLLTPDGEIVGLPDGITAEDARKLGAVALNKKDDEDLQGIAVSERLVSFLDDLSKEVFTAKGAMAGLVDGSTDFIAAKLRLDEAAALYKSDVSAFLAPVSRNIFKERGVLTDKDIDRLRAAFPSFGDTATLSAAKMGALNLLIKESGRIAKQVIFAKEIPSNWETEKRRLLDLVAPQGNKGPASPPPKQGKGGGSTRSYKELDLEPVGE